MLEEERPDWRWLIMGPARSGSAFHVDPNQVPTCFHLCQRDSKKAWQRPCSVPKAPSAHIGACSGRDEEHLLARGYADGYGYYPSVQARKGAAAVLRACPHAFARLCRVEHQACGCAWRRVGWRAVGWR